MSNKPSAVIMRHVKGEEAVKSMEAAYASAEFYREQAVAHLIREWDRIHEKQESERAYESPAWPFLQADCNGALRTIEQILKDVFNVEVRSHGPKKEA